MAQLILLGGAPATLAAEAPNVTSATCVLTYQPFSSASEAVWSGTINLPTTATNYADLKYIVIVAVSPTGTAYELENGRFQAPFSGSTIAYTAWNDSILQTAASQVGWSVSFACYDEHYAMATGAYTVSGFTIAALLPASVAAQDNPSLRWQDQNSALHTVVSFVITPTAAFTPCEVTMAIDYSDGNGPIWQGGDYMATSGQTMYIGCPTSANGAPNGLVSQYAQYAPSTGSIYPSTVAGTKWVLWVAFGNFTPGQMAAAIAGGTAVASPAFEADILPCLATDITDAALVPDANGNTLEYALNALGNYTWTFNEIALTLPTLAQDPNFWFGFITWQKGYLDGSGWHPSPDAEGANSFLDGTMTAQGTLLAGASTGAFSIPGGQIQIKGDVNNPPWSFPPAKNPDGSTNLYTSFQLLIYCVSRLGTNAQGGIGAITLQAGAFGGTGHLILAPVQQTAALDLSQASSGSIGPALAVAAGKLGVKITGPLYVDVSNSLNLLTATGPLYINGSNALAMRVAAPLYADVSNNLNIGPGTALISGTLIFENAGTGAAVEIGSAGIILADNLSAPANTVTVASTGVSVAHGANSVGVSSTGVLIAGPAGQLGLTAAGIVAYASTTGAALQLGPSGLTLTDNYTTPVNTITITSIGAYAGVSIAHGSNSVAITANGVGIYGPLGSVVLTSAGVTITNGVLTAASVSGGAISGATLTLAIVNGSDTKTITLDPTASWLQPIKVTSALHGSYSCMDPDGGFITYGGSLGQTGQLLYNAMKIMGTQVVGTRQTSPGAPAGFADATAQTWCLNLLKTLSAAYGGHGLLT